MTVGPGGSDAVLTGRIPVAKFFMSTDQPELLTKFCRVLDANPQLQNFRQILFNLDLREFQTALIIGEESVIVSGDHILVESRRLRI